jgi:hypothetical protein
MKKYALVFAAHYSVMLYESWLEYQVGCVLETSDDREYLEAEAEERNIAVQQDLYEDEEAYDQQFN